MDKAYRCSYCETEFSNPSHGRNCEDYCAVIRRPAPPPKKILSHDVDPKAINALWPLIGLLAFAAGTLFGALCR
jgi:hypothetical protein